VAEALPWSTLRSRAKVVEGSNCAISVPQNALHIEELCESCCVKRCGHLAQLGEHLAQVTA
jgi:hypothetical protein